MSFFSCSKNVQKGGSELVSANLYEKEKLNITYSKSIVHGKSVSLDVYVSENVVNIAIIGAIIPDVNYINLGTVKYEGTADKFTFKAEKEVNGSIMYFNGGLQNGICTIDLLYELANQSLTKMWYLASSERTKENSQDFFLNIDWESSINTIPTLGMDLDAFCSDLLSPMISELIVDTELVGFEFKKDGNIIPRKIDDLLPSISSLNIAIYNIIEDNRLKLLLNPMMFIETPEKTTRHVDIYDIIEMIETGVELKYNLKDNRLSISLELSKNVISSISELLPRLAVLIPDNDLGVMIKLVVNDLTSILLQTTKLNMRFELDSENNISKPEDPSI